MDNTLSNINTKVYHDNLIAMLQLFNIEHVSFLTRMTLDGTPSLTGVFRNELIEHLQSKGIIVGKVYTPLDLNLKQSLENKHEFNFGDAYSLHMRTYEDALLAAKKTNYFSATDIASDIDKKEIQRQRFKNFREKYLKETLLSTMEQGSPELNELIARLKQSCEVDVGLSKQPPNDRDTMKELIGAFYHHMTWLKSLNNESYSKGDIFENLVVEDDAFILFDNLIVEDRTIIYVDDSERDRNSVLSKCNEYVLVTAPPYMKEHFESALYISLKNFMVQLLKRMPPKRPIGTNELMVITSFAEADYTAGNLSDAMALLNVAYILVDTMTSDASTYRKQIFDKILECLKQNPDIESELNSIDAGFEKFFDCDPVQSSLHSKSLKRLHAILNLYKALTKLYTDLPSSFSNDLPSFYGRFLTATTQKDVYDAAIVNVRAAIPNLSDELLGDDIYITSCHGLLDDVLEQCTSSKLRADLENLKNNQLATTDRHVKAIAQQDTSKPKCSIL